MPTKSRGTRIVPPSTVCVIRTGAGVAISALLLLQTRAARADVLWKGDFETGDLSQWGSQLNLKTGQRTNITVVGSPVEQGKHAALLAQGGLYAQFWARQSGGFLGADVEEAAE